MTAADLVVRGRRVLTPDGLREAAVLVREGRIAAVVPPHDTPEAARVEDAGDAVVLPGLVDSHVHVNEPGRTDWEGCETATRAAAAGGVTTIADMPLNCIPVTTTLAALRGKLAAVEGKAHVDCAFWGGLVPGNAGELRAMAAAGVAGFKCFLVHSGIDDFPRVEERDLREAMPVLRDAGVPLLVHAELDRGGDRGSEDRRAYARFLASRPARWEVAAIEMMIRLCRETGCAVHIVHLSAADAVGPLARARAEGLPITVETCPHYLTLAAEDVPDGDTRFKCAPPIRGRENRERLWRALADGTIDMVVSDHSPCTVDRKRLASGDFDAAWGGVSSLQLALAATWTGAHARGRGIEDLGRWMCAAPARLLGLSAQKGAIARGHDADLVVWDPDATFAVEAARLEHRNKLTPYEGRTLSGVVERTFLRGRVVYERGRFTAPVGRLLTRHTRAARPTSE